MTKSIIDLQHIDVTFKDKKRTVPAVRNASLKINYGDIYGIVGYSGAGKSTLVRVIDLLQRPNQGKVIIDGSNILNYHYHQLLALRKEIGVVFQHYNLMNSRTVLNNVEFPLFSSKLSRRQRKQRSHRLLKLVGLDSKSSYYPAQLSGGQKQRVAIARALANHPKVLISDEATSALDPKNTNLILKLLKKLNQQLHLSIVLITHEMDAVKAICNKVAFMDNGRIMEHGSLFDVFSRPRHQQTQEFIHRNDSLTNAIKQIKLQQPQLVVAHHLFLFKYLGSDVNEPLIINLYRKFSVIASVMYGNVEFIQQVPIGHLIVSLNGEDQDIQQAIKYCQNLKVHVKNLY